MRSYKGALLPPVWLDFQGALRKNHLSDKILAVPLKQKSFE